MNEHKKTPVRKKTPHKKAVPAKKKTTYKAHKICTENLFSALEKIKIDPEEIVPLSEKEEIWCRAFIKCKNASEAGRVAGWEGKSAGVIGSGMKRRPLVRLRLAQLWEDEKKRLKLDPDDVLEELGRIARADIHDVLEIDEEGKEVTIKRGFDGRTVKSLSTTYDADGRPRIKVEFWNKDRALENYGRYHKLFTDGLGEAIRSQVQIFKIGDQEIEF